MKNLKKVIFALMVVFLVVGFIGCKTESDPPKAPVVTNNFKGNVFVAEYSVESWSGIWGYIEFIDDTNGKMGISNYDEESNPIITDQPFTYSVTDDVATIKATMYGREVTVTTSKLTDGIFTFSTEGVDEETGETYSTLVTCTKGDKSLFDVWTVYYDEEEVMKDFFYEFEDYVKVLDVEDDYELDTANKKIVLTENGYKKCCQPWTIVADGENNENEDYIESMLMFNMLGLNKPTDYTIDIDSLTITVTESGMEKIQDATWTISYPDEDFERTVLEFMLLDFYESFGLVDGDYTKDDATKTITLTASGWEKLYGSEDEEGWTVVDSEGNTLMTFESLEAAQAYAEENGLTSDDYTVDEETHTITLMGGGSGGEDSGEVTGWTVMYSGITVQTFDSFEEAETFASSIGLVEDDDYTVDYESQIITLTDAGAEKVGMGGDTEGGDSGEVYYYKHNGELCGGKNTLEDFYYEVELYDLVEGTDYTIDYKNGYIDFTDSGYAKLGY